MRLAAAADLHWGLDPRGDRATCALAGALRALQPDVLVLAGDVGEGDEFRRCLAQFSGVSCVRLLVPGNHDLWVRDPEQSSLELYENELPRAAAEEGFHLLDGAPYAAPDARTALVGSINWYDYSFADPRVDAEFPLAREMYRAKRFPRGWHNDGRFVRLGMSDEEFTARVVRRFGKDLAAVPGEVEHVIAVLHHPPLPQLFYPSPLETADQRFWLAYTGNRRMEAAVLADPRIRTVLCGHTHAFQRAEVEGRRCLNIGGDYSWKRLLLLDTESGAEEWRDFRD